MSYDISSFFVQLLDIDVNRYFVFYYRTTVFQSMKLGIDVNRHKEIIVKAISGLILLMLKHFKLNHIYQVST